jgi:hypothetical protein
LSPAPTSSRLLEKSGTLWIVITHDESGDHRRLAKFSNIQREILKLLGFPDTALKTFKGRCRT